MLCMLGFLFASVLRFLLWCAGIVWVASCTQAPHVWWLTSAACRCVVTDLGAFVLINVYAPNAGDRKSDNGRIDYKVRFLDALKHKADLFRDAGKEVYKISFCQPENTDFNLWQYLNLMQFICQQHSDTAPAVTL